MRDGPRLFRVRPKTIYIVVNHYGRFGTAFAETDLDRANHETTIADLMSGQHCDPLRVVMFNPDTNRPKMSRTPSRRRYCAASALKAATCRQCWRTSLIATLAQIAS